MSPTAFPKIDQIKVNNFQSLSDAAITLGSLTVIVGPSNSGKSAFLRALKAVARNVNSPSAVRVGKSTFTAEVRFGESAVSIERGKSQSTYRAFLPNGEEDVFTKAGRSVPEDIQKLLGLPEPEGPDLTFSSQIDPPFLLAETGTVAAKMLGDLTNVSKLHAAAKEANRRRLEASRLREVRIKDVEAVRTRMTEEFSDLKTHAATVREARAEFDAVREKVALGEKIDSALSDLALIESAEDDLRTRLDTLPEPADIEAQAEEAGRLMGTRHVITDSLTTLARLTESEEILESEIEKASAEEARLGDLYWEVLKEAGKCPTCEQKVA